MFTSEHGIKFQNYFLDAREAYGIDFADGSKVYDFGFQTAHPNLKPRFDPRVKVTLLGAILEFFKNEDNSMIFTCSNTDGKEAFRKRIFHHWYSSSPDSHQFIKKDFAFDEDGVGVYASYIALRRSPHTEHNLAVINELVEALRSGSGPSAK